MSYSRWLLIVMAMAGHSLAEPELKSAGSGIAVDNGAVALQEERYGECLTRSVRKAWWEHPGGTLDVSVGRNSENQTVLRVHCSLGDQPPVDHLFKYSEVSVTAFDEGGKELAVAPLSKASESYTKGGKWSSGDANGVQTTGDTATGYYAIAGEHETVSKVKIAVNDLKVSFFIPPKTMPQYSHGISVSLHWMAPGTQEAYFVVDFGTGDFRIKYNEVKVKAFTSDGKEIKAVPVPWGKDKDSYYLMSGWRSNYYNSSPYVVDAKENISKVTVEWKGETTEFKRTIEWDRYKMEE